MRSSNKSRSRNKNQNRRPQGNVINRVFDSSGPEGKVRGTPQQIIEKYQMLARDAQLSGDRVAAENFQQHAEHYTRLLGEATREQNERQQQHNQQNEANQQAQQRSDASDGNERSNDRPRAVSGNEEQPDIPMVPVQEMQRKEDTQSGLVETPEGSNQRPAPRKRTRRPKPDDTAPAAETATEQPAPVQPAPEPNAAE
jgi:hypothetical protein